MTVATLANEYVTDTVGLVLQLEKRKLEAASKSVFDAAEAGATTIYIPAMVFAEIMYLSERKRISASLQDATHYIQRFSNIKQYPITRDVVQAAQEITDIPELHDRIIAGTARLLSSTLITSDHIIQASRFVTTLW